MTRRSGRGGIVTRCSTHGTTTRYSTASSAPWPGASSGGALLDVRGGNEAADRADGAAGDLPATRPPLEDEPTRRPIELPVAVDAPR
jgi:hypothetical protein